MFRYDILTEAYYIKNFFCCQPQKYGCFENFNKYAVMLSLIK